MAQKILIVDDEPNVLRFVGYAFQKAGYEVVPACDSEEALEKVQRTQPDLVILDVMLPTASGLDVCQALRSRSETTALPIIMFSARSQVSDKIAGLEAGADEYLTKPIDPDELIARVAALLERTERLRQVPAVRQAKTIGFIGAKGGVGISTIVMNIAAVLSKSPKRCITLELCGGFGSFSTALRLMPTYNLAGLLELTPQKIDQRTLTKFITRHGSGIEAVFGPQKVSEFQTIPSDQAEAIVDGLKGMADYLLIDFPTLVEPGVQPALQSCDFVVVALEPDTLSATAAKATLATLNAWGISSGMIGVIVVNKRILSMQLNDIRSYLGCEILGVIPPAAEDALLALTRGIPLVQFRPTNTAVLQLTELAAILSGEKQPALTGSR